MKITKIEDENHEIEDKKCQKYYKIILLFNLIIKIELTLLIKIKYFKTKKLII